MDEGDESHEAAAEEDESLKASSQFVTAAEPAFMKIESQRRVSFEFRPARGDVADRQSGTEAQLAAVRKDYGIAAAKIKNEGQPDGWSHSAFTYLIDRDGKLRALMPYGHPAADFVNDLRLLLAAP